MRITIAEGFVKCELLHLTIPSLRQLPLYPLTCPFVMSIPIYFYTLRFRAIQFIDFHNSSSYEYYYRPRHRCAVRKLRNGDFNFTRHVYRGGGDALHYVPIYLIIFWIIETRAYTICTAMVVRINRRLNNYITKVHGITVYVPYITRKIIEHRGPLCEPQI